MYLVRKWKKNNKHISLSDEYEEFLRRRKEAEEKNESISSQSVVRLNIPLSACIEAFSSTETIDDYYSTAVKQKTNALK